LCLFFRSGLWSLLLISIYVIDPNYPFDRPHKVWFVSGQGTQVTEQLHDLLWSPRGWWGDLHPLWWTWSDMYVLLHMLVLRWDKVWPRDGLLPLAKNEWWASMNVFKPFWRQRPNHSVPSPTYEEGVFMNLYVFWFFLVVSYERCISQVRNNYHLNVYEYFDFWMLNEICTNCMSFNVGHELWVSNVLCLNVFKCGVKLN